MMIIASMCVAKSAGVVITPYKALENAVISVTTFNEVQKN